MQRQHITDSDIHAHQVARAEYESLLQLYLNDIRKIAKTGALGPMTTAELNELLNEQEKEMRWFTLGELRAEVAEQLAS